LAIDAPYYMEDGFTMQNLVSALLTSKRQLTIVSECNRELRQAASPGSLGFASLSPPRGE